MQTELNIHGEDYKQVVYVICRRAEQLKDDPNGWLHHHTYTDLEKAKVGLKKLIAHNRYNLEYKIRKFVITAKDIITDKTFSLLDNRDTCKCFHCGKTIEAGDELIFGDATEEIYCSHECVSLNIDNEEWTALSDPDEYLHWFPEK
jgi:hypothetical protein